MPENHIESEKDSIFVQRVQSYTAKNKNESQSQRELFFEEPFSIDYLCREDFPPETFPTEKFPPDEFQRSSSSPSSLPPPPIFMTNGVLNQFETNDVLLDRVYELLQEPVEEMNGERIVWEYHKVLLSRVPGYGFGIAVSGGRDNPHFTNGDPSIAISDVLKDGPAEEKLLINDRVISANNVSLENVDYATAVQVLRDSGQSVHLLVKRRMVLPSSKETNRRVTLIKKNKKDDFGIILGCKIYIKEIVHESLAEKIGTLKEGDFISKINSTSTEGLSYKEVKRLLEASKDKLDLILSSKENIRNFRKNEEVSHIKSYQESMGVTSQNLYVQPPSRSSTDDLKVNGIRGEVPPPRPPPPPETGLVVSDDRALNPLVPDYGRLKNSSEEETPEERTHHHTNSHSSNLPDPRFISFHKAGSVGIRLTGGNDVGIFVTAVQAGSPASSQGLTPGDKILKVNGNDMKGVTREEAVLFLLSLSDTINLIAQFRREEYESILSLSRGDSFYIKAHFNYETPERGEMSFKKSDVFHVVDTLHNGVVGAWQVFRMDPFVTGLSHSHNTQIQKGVIPNKARAEEIATRQFNAAKKEQNLGDSSKGTGSFFRRKRDKSQHRRSKSLGKDHWEDLVWSESMSKFPAYERVFLRHPGFPRPVVIFGPVADIARERLIKDYPIKFASPQTTDDLTKNKSGIVRLSSIRDIMDRRKHALLDVTPNAVDKLNYAQFYPIVIFTKADTKQTIKESRSGIPKKAHISSKKLFEQCQKLEKIWTHVFTTSLILSNEYPWYPKLLECIDKQQTAPIWMAESKTSESFSDDFLFPMNSRLSYASSPESDAEFFEPETPTPSRNIDRLPRSSSDPSLADGKMESSYKPYASGVVSAVDKSDTYGFNIPNSGVESVDELPLPPHPSSLTRFDDEKPEVPPKIERNKKPLGNRKSATERLFGKEESNSIDVFFNGGNSLDRKILTKDLKMNIYDAHKTYNGSIEKQTHRSSVIESSKAQLSKEPLKYSTSNGVHTSYDKYRYSDYKPVPLPKSSAYKPIPPPKPKSFSRNQMNGNGEGNYMNSGHFHPNSKYSAPPPESRFNDDDSTGFDSGQGSSLDREYQAAKVSNNSRGQYYYNVPSSPLRNGDGLDLSNREYRGGSAFELYKKPLSAILPSGSSYYNSSLGGRL